ncbi:MAG: hypothetical protein HY226_04840 [Candidatus Vogelbacteria bacterium]|nr:hypothetical protein [Candidatus Vogelbacteria bacterium]
MKKIVLTEEEWNLLCDRTFDKAADDYRCKALPVCCANVSALRDEIICLRKRKGELLPENKAALLQNCEFVKDGHDYDWTILDKLMGQVKED